MSERVRENCALPARLRCDSQHDHDLIADRSSHRRGNVISGSFAARDLALDRRSRALPTMRLTNYFTVNGGVLLVAGLVAQLDAAALAATDSSLLAALASTALLYALVFAACAANLRGRRRMHAKAVAASAGPLLDRAPPARSALERGCTARRSRRPPPAPLPRPPRRWRWCGWARRGGRGSRAGSSPSSSPSTPSSTWRTGASTRSPRSTGRCTSCTTRTRTTSACCRRCR